MDKNARLKQRARQRMNRAKKQSEVKYDAAMLDVQERAEHRNNKYRFNHVKDLTPYNTERVAQGGTILYK